MFENITYYTEEAVKPCNAGRAYSYKHETKPNTAVMCIHGYEGYPGELVRPAFDLFNAGFDVFVPRLKGHGTNSEDFLKTDYNDWISSASSLYDKLLKEYETVHLVGHSMGCAVAVLIWKEGSKLVLTAPALMHRALNPRSVFILKILSKFTKKKRTEWERNPSYKMHYFNAPSDDQYLGSQYWSYMYPNQLLSLYTLMKMSQERIKTLSDFLLIIPEKDYNLGVYSLDYVRENVKNKYNVKIIKNGTHFVYYDIDSGAEEEAVKETVSFLAKEGN